MISNSAWNSVAMIVTIIISTLLFGILNALMIGFLVFVMIPYFINEFNK